MSGYDFSLLYNASLVVYSPGASFIATLHQHRIIIRSAKTLQIVRTFQCLPPTASTSKLSSFDKPIVDSISWSSDSMYLLAYGKEGMGWVFALAEKGNGEGGEVGRFGEGVEGMVKAEWGMGEGRDVLVWSDYGLRLTIHSLTTGESRYIQYPKSHDGCHAYSPDHRYLAVAERHSSKDSIGIYDVHQGYALVRYFSVSTTDLQSISWSPCGKWLAICDTVLQCAVHIHSPLGPHLSTFSSLSPTFSPSNNEDPGLGVRIITWSPTGRWLLIGGYDGRVRVLESEGWRCVAVFGGGGRVERSSNLWKEPGEWIKETRGRGIVQFDRLNTPASLPASRADRHLSQSQPKTGIASLSFDPDGCLLAIQQESQPNIVQIWSFLPEPTFEHPEVKLKDVMMFEKGVTGIDWRPHSPDFGGEKANDEENVRSGRKLGVVSRSGGVYLWDECGDWVEVGADDGGREGSMVEGVGIPSQTPFHATSLKWSPEGTSLILQDKAHFCILYDEPVEGKTWDGVEGLTEVLEEEEEVSLDEVGLGLGNGWRSGRGGILA